jgi:isochorismate synthase EntC
MIKTIQTEKRYTDADAAHKMHCTPANAGFFRKKLRQFLMQNGVKL